MVCPGTINTPIVSDMLAKEPDTMKDILKDQPIGRLGQRKRSLLPFSGFAALAQASSPARRLLSMADIRGAEETTLEQSRFKYGNQKN